jgi:hypothetical protein
MSKKIEFALSQPCEKSKFNIKPLKTPFYNCHPYFSFKYYHKQHNKFSIKNIKTLKEIKELFDKLHELSQYKWQDIFANKNKYHAHKVNWTKTNFKRGFTHLPDEIREMPVFQFKAFKECRILGFFNKDNVFKIVWIDRDHLVYKRK